MMNASTKPGGAVVPLVTPCLADGRLDPAAVDRLVESQASGGVEGVLVLGTTGEGPSVPAALHRPLIERAAAAAAGRLRVYANVAGTCLADAVAAGNDYLDAGADAVALLPPYYYPSRDEELAGWFSALLDGIGGPAVIYNIPATTGVSIPLDVVGGLVDHPRLVAIKDSEKDEARHTELLRRFGGRDDFSVFIGVGALMAHGLKLGADGIVPSSGNLIPAECQRQVEAARRGDWEAVDASATRQAEVAAAYQNGRTLGQSLAALKGLAQQLGLCGPDVFPPLLRLPDDELAALGEEAKRLKLP